MSLCSFWVASVALNSSLGWVVMGIDSKEAAGMTYSQLNHTSKNCFILVSTDSGSVILSVKFCPTLFLSRFLQR